DPQRARRAGRVVYARGPVLRHPDDPFAEVADVDELHRVRRLPRDEDLTTPMDPGGPVGEAVGRIPGPDDQAGADDGGPTGEPALRLGLREGFERSVEAAAAPVEGFERLRVGIAPGVGGEGGALRYPRARVAGVDGDRGDEDVMLCAIPQDRRGVPDPDRERGGIVDHYVPLPASQGVEVSIPVSDEVLHLGWKVRLPPPPIEHSDVVAPSHRVMNLGRADEA